MTKAELQDKLMELPVEERLDIAQTLWDSAAPEPALTDEQKALLERRRAAFLTDPDSFHSWEDVKAAPEGVRARSPRAHGSEGHSRRSDARARVRRLTV